MSDAQRNLATFADLIALFNVLDVETALSRHYADDASTAAPKFVGVSDDLL